MGEVWSARDERLGRDVAVKILHPWVAEDPDLRDRLERESIALARLTHPGVVRLYDAQHDGRRSFIVMELVEGTNLSAVIAARGRLSWQEARDLLRPVAEALAYAHDRGVVHRDLSPANVLVERPTRRVVVTDFGLARLARAGLRSTTGVLAGTPEYWAPEQARGATTGPPADVYALGCILYRGLAGRLPFAGEDRLATGLQRVHEDAPPLASVVDGVPPEGAALVDAMLARSPEARPSADTVARALGAAPAPGGAADADVPDASASPTLQPATRPLDAGPTIGRRRHAYTARRRRRGAVAAAVVGAVAATAGGVYALVGAESPGIAAPSVVGATLGQARSAVSAAADAAGVETPSVRVAGRGYSEKTAEGGVVAQSPPSGKHVESSGALWVRLSLGSAWADVPSVVGMPSREAAASLRAAGFTPVRRYAPSTSVPAWQVVETSPGVGERVRRPARVQILVSTGPPKVPVPAVVGEGADDAVQALADAGFEPVTQERMSSTADPGTVLELSPAPGTRVPQGSAVTAVVAREPEWTTLAGVDSSDARDTGPVAVPAGARVVLVVDNTSFFDLEDGAARARWSGDDSGEVEMPADRHDVVLVEPADRDRTISFAVEPTAGQVHWYLRVESAS
jgi:serine/threonine-protein kinase